MSVALIVCLGLVGWAMEVSHPAFFPAEPLVVWTEDVNPPTLFFCGNPWPADWHAEEEGGRFRWETALHQAPLGIWTICAEGICVAVLRVPQEASLVEIVGAPPGSFVHLGEQEIRAVGEQGRSFFVTTPGEQKLILEYECGRFEEHIVLAAGERLVFKFGELLGLNVSSSEVLPGEKIRLELIGRSLIPLPYLAAQISLPENWRIETQEELLLPIPPQHQVHRNLTIRIPEDNACGTYEIAVRWQGWELKAKVKVGDSLSPLVVIGHWDVQRNVLDLSSPFALTYERVLWASSLLGQPIPYTTELMTPELLNTVLEAWASDETK